ncbi:MAG: flagellar hook-basal body complex protein FliE [Acidobacteriota bacterium]|nr:flagellar hook-basal body complex protein FliE [Acidobacteriota bacterium]
MTGFQGDMAGLMQSVGGVFGALQPTASGTDSTGNGAVPFEGLMRSIVAQTNALDKQATAAVTGVMSGSGVDIHDAMIATQKADMSFELALQVRNKAVAAYQQMINMQF